MKLNILILANTSINKPGNIGVRVGKILRALEEDNHKVFCYARGSKLSNKKIFYFPFFELIGRGLNFTRLHLIDFNHRLIDSYIFEVSTFLFLFFYDFSEVDIVICFEYMPNILRFFRKRDIITITDIPITLENYKLVDYELFSNNNLKYRKSIDNLEQASIKNSDHVICTNKISQSLIKNISPKTKSHLCQYTVEPIYEIKFLLKKKELIINKEKQINYVFVGNLSSRKGIIPTIEAWADFFIWANINIKNYCFNLKLLGKNNENIDIPFGTNIEYLGFIDPKNIYAKSHFFLLASFQEGYPKALAEAKSFGCVPITTLLTEGLQKKSSKNNNFFNIKSPEKKHILTALKESAKKLDKWHKMSEETYMEELNKESYQNQICSIFK